MLEVNTNHLGGFTIDQGPPGAKVVSRHAQLLRIEGISGSGQLRLHYAPWYKWPVIGAALAAIAVALATAWASRRMG